MCEKLRFDSILVRLKVSINHQNHKPVLSFDSILVRLKGILSAVEKPLQ